MLVSTLFVAVAGILCQPSFAAFATESSQETTQQLPPEIEAPQHAGAPVEIDGRTIFFIHVAAGGFSTEERAENITQRILGIARRRSVPAETIREQDRGAWAEIDAGTEPIMAVTEEDAKTAGRPRVQIAAEYAEAIRQTVTRYRQEHTLGNLIRGVVTSVVATIILLAAFVVILRLRRAARSKLEAWISKTEDRYSANSLRFQFKRYLTLPLMGVGAIAVIASIFVLLEVYLWFVLSSFPTTRYTAFLMNRWSVQQVMGLLKAAWSYLPNLVVVVIIIVGTRYVIQLEEYIFREIREGTLVVRGFYPDWAQPTSRLVRLLIIAAAAVVIFPYLPGSSSPAFRGISVFLGVLLSLGSTSAVAHGVAGTILTYMRAFSVGDFVKIGDSVGEVVERNLLVTRIRSQKNEVVTIPSGTVLGGIVVNYSAEARNNGVIFYTRVSIGYNAPWRDVHNLLIAAARATEDILSSPSPFVLQSSLDDFYVSYELNAFTRHPERMLQIYSALHENIQDKFNEAGIEINSPHYAALRDGNRVAVPEAYIPRDYREPVFGIREVANHSTAGLASDAASKVVPPRS